MSKEIKWTDDQKKAIDHNKGTVLVSAAAGSGKTAVLVERIVKKLYTTDIDQYVIVTFTEAAASQMKKGISSEIRERLADIGLNNQVKNHLKKQLLLLPDASISTMHSFCSSIIRTNFDKLDISSDFSIIQPEDRKLVFRNAYDEITEKLYEEKNSAFLSLVSCYCKKTNDDDLFKMAESLFEASRGMPYPEEWLLESLGNLNRENYLNSGWFKWFTNYLKDQVSGLKYRYESNKDFVTNNPQLEKYEFFINDLSISEIILNAFENENLTYGELYDLFNVKFSTNSFNKDVSNTLEADEFKKIRNEYKEGFKTIFDRFFLYDETSFLKFLDIAYSHAQTLVNLVLEIAENFKNKKNNANVLDYNDLEHYAIKLLLDENHNPSETAKEISSQYLEIIIDEYQDTNPIQEVIFNAISKNSENLFMVGDMKQSIYKFRNADPSLFSQKINSYSFDENSEKRKIFLSQNFRSRNTILDFSNLVFGACMNKSTGEIDYKDEECLYFGQESFKKEDDSPVEVMLIDDCSDEKTLTSTEKEANIIGLKIQQMVESKVLVYDKSENALRPVEYKDFAILLRTAKNVVSVFSRVLTNMGIPVFVDDNTYYLLSSYEIKILMSFLKVVDNPTDDIATATLLKSPIFGINDDTLALISRENQTGFYNKAINYNPEIISEKIKLDNFKKTILKYRKLKNYMPVNELLREFLLETNFCEYVLNMSGGEQRVININFLLKIAGYFEEENYKGVYEFINYIENYDDKTASILSPKKMPDNLNSVTITTIHKSKGLEYPVVILANSGKKFNLSMADNIEFHNNLGFAFNCITEDMLSLKSPIKNIIKERKNIEEISEEMRILYVALTRAKERLIISGTINTEKYFDNLKVASGERLDKLSEYTTQTARSLLDWIGLALVRTSAFEAINIDNNIIVKNALREIPFVKAYIIKFDEFMTQANEAPAEKEAETGVSSEDVSENLSYKYPHTANEIYTKYSVSSIKQNKAYVSNYYRHFEKLQALSMDNEELTPAEKGTLSHFILEKAVNSKINCENDLNQLIFTLKEQQLLSPAEEKEINRKGIMNFIASDIGSSAISSNEVYTEAPFEIFEDSSVADEDVSGVNILIQGVIDLYFKDGDKYVIVDYKTDNINPVNKEERIKTYKIQLDLYKSAVKKMHKTNNVTSYIYFLNTNEFIEV